MVEASGRKNGFSLVELLAVIAIIGILAVIGIPQYQKFKIKAFQAEAKTQLNAIFSAEHTFFLEYQGYHSSLQVIGYAPAGRARYNIGFATVGTPAPTAPVETTFLSTVSICSGPYGGGVDTRCQIVVVTPSIDPGATVTATGFSASASAFEDELTASNSSNAFNSYAYNVVFGNNAYAAGPTIPGGVPAPIDVWTMTEQKILSNKKTSLTGR